MNTTIRTAAMFPSPLLTSTPFSFPLLFLLPLSARGRQKQKQRPAEAKTAKSAKCFELDKPADGSIIRYTQFDEEQEHDAEEDDAAIPVASAHTTRI